MLPKKTTLVLQIAMTFIIAWPIAFIYTRLINPIAFKIAFKVAPPSQG